MTKKKNYANDMQPFILEMGKRAYIEGIDLIDNPFRLDDPFGMLLAKFWDDGWYEEKYHPSFPKTVT